MKKYKKIHKSWKDKAEKDFLHSNDKTSYLCGANDFRNQALEAMELFSVITLYEPIIYGNRIYVSQEDVVTLLEGLYAEVKIKKAKL